MITVVADSAASHAHDELPVVEGIVAAGEVTSRPSTAGSAAAPQPASGSIPRGAGHGCAP